MGYAWNSICYPTTGEALNAFVLNAVSIDAAGINTFTALPTISVGGLITWSISNRPLTATAATTRTGTTQLPTCTTENMSQFPMQSITLLAVLAFAAILGLRTGFRP